MLEMSAYGSGIGESGRILVLQSGKEVEVAATSWVVHVALVG
jgi:hypothetical protein